MPALLVLAGETDRTAHDFVARQTRHGAVLITPRDLSRPGWRFSVADPGESVAVAGDRLIPAREIAGVLSRLPGITEADLPHIHRDDRAYVAAEMTAFLLAFLTGLGASVVNRPTAQCLCGPAWPAPVWRRLARRLGIAAAPDRRRVPPDSDVPDVPRPGTVLSVVGGACFGAPDPALAAAAQTLAREAGVEMMAAEFTPDGALLGVHQLPELTGADATVLGLFGLRDAA